MISTRRLKKAVNEKEKERMLTEKEDLRRIMEQHPRLFCESFKVGELKVNPIEIDLKE